MWHLGLVRACVIGAGLAWGLLISTEAHAQQGCCLGGSATAANAWTDGFLTATEWPDTGYSPAPDWWSHGEVEVGGRAFLNNPQRNGAVTSNQNSLAKYYEYSSVAQGAFGGAHIAEGSKNGLYGIDLWANNVGYGDQSYLLEANKVGEHYFSIGFDQTPHVYSTSALTPYLGVGTNSLTLPPGLVSKTATPASLASSAHQTDVGIERDTVSANYRWTPTDAWDFRTNYSHTDRTGTQPEGIVGFAPTGGSVFNSPTQVAAPVNDTTQNFGANGEYAGTSPWGQKYTFKVAYNGSLYTDNLSSYAVQNPYCTGNSCTSATLSPFATISTPPSNQANGVSETFAADLPIQSRFVNTTSYTMMRQDATFLPMTDNPGAVASPIPFFGGIPWNTVNFGFINANPANPATNLDGSINTLLINNQLTSQITPELRSKFSYRYYDFDNDTPQIVFPSWVSYDQNGTSHENTVSSLSISYIKQNAAAELNWRPAREWNFTAGYGFERYDYTQTDVNVTNENSAKFSADWKPLTWFTARSSVNYGDRRYDNYDYNAFVRAIQFPTVTGFTPTTSNSWFYSPAYQQFMFDNRQRTNANFALDIVAFPGVTVSPTVKYHDDFYGLNPLNQEGVNNSQSLSWGADVAYVVNPSLSFAVSYYRELYNQSLYNYTNNGSNSAAPGSPNFLITTSDKEFVNTVTAVVNYAAIPNRLDLDLRYAVSNGIDEQTMLTAAPTSACSNCQGQFPNDTTLFQRLDATATYKFDPTVTAQLGFKGDIKAKLRYTWERNSVSNWQNDALAPFTDIPGLTNSLWLAYDNPNYNVHMIAASLIATW